MDDVYVHPRALRAAKDKAEAGSVVTLRASNGFVNKMVVESIGKNGDTTCVWVDRNGNFMRESIGVAALMVVPQKVG